MTKIRYQVRGKQLMDMVRDINDNTIIISPHFQRKLVWREVHKVDFIKTILLGYPFPEIFLAKGDIDVDNMTSTSCIVDGQQRMNAILEFTQNQLKVDGKYFKEFSPGIREDFIKYEIAVIDLELDRNDNQVVEIFKRLNRTFYSLSQVEKISTEYASSYMMLVTKLLCGEFIKKTEDEDNIIIECNVDPLLASEDPNISSEFLLWANEQNVSDYWKLILENIFTPYEISRQVPIMYTLNLITTHIYGIYNRNDQITPHLEKFANELFCKDEIVTNLNNTSRFLMELNLVDKGFWYSKSNSFSLISALLNLDKTSMPMDELRNQLNNFAQNPDPEYVLSAKEAVNNKRERTVRFERINELIRAAIC